MNGDKPKGTKRHVAFRSSLYCSVQMFEKSLLEVKNLLQDKKERSWQVETRSKKIGNMYSRSIIVHKLYFFHNLRHIEIIALLTKQLAITKSDKYKIKRDLYR